jgi:hypothetical protein
MNNKAARHDALRDSLIRSREINISVIGRKSGRTISNPVWFVLDEDKLYLLLCGGQIHNGTKTCSRIPRFESAQAAWKLNLRSFLSLRHHGWYPWSKNSVTSMGRATSGNTTQSSTLPLSLRCRDGILFNCRAKLPLFPNIGQGGRHRCDKPTSRY